MELGLFPSLNMKLTYKGQKHMFLPIDNRRLGISEKRSPGDLHVYFRVPTDAPS
jgi:hypothetical protein